MSNMTLKYSIYILEIIKDSGNVKYISFHNNVLGLDRMLTFVETIILYLERRETKQSSKFLGRHNVE